MEGCGHANNVGAGRDARLGYRLGVRLRDWPSGK